MVQAKTKPATTRLDSAPMSSAKIASCSSREKAGPVSVTTEVAREHFIREGDQRLREVCLTLPLRADRPTRRWLPRLSFLLSPSSQRIPPLAYRHISDRFAFLSSCSSTAMRNKQKRGKDHPLPRRVLRRGPELRPALFPLARRAPCTRMM